MIITPRNKIEAPGLHSDQLNIVDALFDLCDAEFNSRTDVHSSFNRAKGAASWARYYLLHEVRRVAERNELYCSYHMAFVVATKLSEIWFEQKETA